MVNNAYNEVIKYKFYMTKDLKAMFIKYCLT